MSAAGGSPLAGGSRARSSGPQSPGDAGEDAVFRASTPSANFDGSPLVGPDHRQEVAAIIETHRRAGNALRPTNRPPSLSGRFVFMPPQPFPAIHDGVLSVVVPIYNEAATVRTALDAILAKEVPGWRLEVILVESNSTDGTREIVRGYEAHPRVKLILEDRPRGKGHAVRAGFAQATGDVILIQDADLEYELDDYEILLAPLAAGRQSFVLGSRHGAGGWAIRQFTDQPLQAIVLNLAHWGFTLLINISLGIWLRDPFTMYKVFRRGCLDGLTFECNRFDFDWELLIKLVRKGHRPIEIPVSYKSRSFKEGKKISMFRDPLTWLWALARCRFQRLG